MGKQIPSADPDRGFTPVVNAAAANGLVAKSRAGNLYGFTGYSTVDGWFLALDLAAIPANGDISASLEDFWPYAAGQAFGVNFGDFPLAMVRGIVIVFSTTGPYTFTGSATATISAKVK